MSCLLGDCAKNWEPRSARLGSPSLLLSLSELIRAGRKVGSDGRLRIIHEAEKYSTLSHPITSNNLIYLFGLWLEHVELDELYPDSEAFLRRLASSKANLVNMGNGGMLDAPV